MGQMYSMMEAPPQDLRYHNINRQGYPAARAPLTQYMGFPNGADTRPMMQPSNFAALQPIIAGGSMGLATPYNRVTGSALSYLSQ